MGLIFALIVSLDSFTPSALNIMEPPVGVQEMAVIPICLELRTVTTLGPVLDYGAVGHGAVSGMVPQVVVGVVDDLFGAGSATLGPSGG